MHKVFNKNCQTRVSPATGFTLIELMIVVAIIAIILTLALPVYSNYSIRAKVSEALSVGAAAKTATSATCVQDPSLTGLTLAKAGHSFNSSPYVNSMTVSGPCTAPIITITTHNIGVSPDPVITLTGDFPESSGRGNWTCTGNVSNVYLPRECRS
jgi:type IV pilus assembly protein PilA